MSSVRVSTYITIGDEYVPVEKFAGPLFDIGEQPGAVEFSISGVRIFDRSAIEDIMPLWSYMLNGLEKVRDVGHVTIGWPSLSYSLAMRIINPSRVLVRRAGGGEPSIEVSAITYDLVDALVSAGAVFCDVMGRLDPTFRDHRATELIQELRPWAAMLRRLHG